MIPAAPTVMEVCKNFRLSIIEKLSDHSHTRNPKHKTVKAPILSDIRDIKTYSRFHRL